jgi:hypothetical protein
MLQGYCVSCGTLPYRWFVECVLVDCTTAVVQNAWVAVGAVFPCFSRFRRERIPL